MLPKFAISVSMFVAAAASAMAVLTPGAEAGPHGIQCRGGAQLVAGSYITTPYCQDELLAQVARGYGMKASAHRIRHNPNYKREVCRFVGHDIRVYEHCSNERPSGRGRRF